MTSTPRASSGCSISDNQLRATRRQKEASEGHWPSVSVSFWDMKNRTGTDGAHEALEGFLANVALVRTGAYQEAQVTNVIRSSIAKVRAWAAWMTAHKPDVDLGAGFKRSQASHRRGSGSLYRLR